VRRSVPAYDAQLARPCSSETQLVVVSPPARWTSFPNVFLCNFGDAHQPVPVCVTLPGYHEILGHIPLAIDVRTTTGKVRSVPALSSTLPLFDRLFSPCILANRLSGFLCGHTDERACRRSVILVPAAAAAAPRAWTRVEGLTSTRMSTVSSYCITFRRIQTGHHENPRQHARQPDART
jgi:hypothetical protein